MKPLITFGVWFWATTAIFGYLTARQTNKLLLKIEEGFCG